MVIPDSILTPDFWRISPGRGLLMLLFYPFVGSQNDSQIFPEILRSLEQLTFGCIWHEPSDEWRNVAGLRGHRQQEYSMCRMPPRRATVPVWQDPVLQAATESSLD
jgi:hypothetical protein